MVPVANSRRCRGPGENEIQRIRANTFSESLF
jgi:hypothetical protein